MKEHRGQEGENGSRMSVRALKNHQTKEETMNLSRKAMVLAVGAALAAPGAHAQITSKAGSDWEFYRKVWPEYAPVNGANPTASDNATRDRITALNNTGASNARPPTSNTPA